MNSLLLGSLAMLLVEAVFSQSAEDVARVHSDLLTNQFPKVRPEKDLSQVTVVNVSFHLISVNDLDSPSQKLSTNGWIKASWRNVYLEWDPANYSGVGRIFPDTDKVWLPRLTVLNSLNELKPVGTSYSFIIVTSSGLTTWYPAEVFETFCEINVKYFPFDIQTCFFTFFNWGEDITEVDFQVTENSVNLTTYHDNGEWELLSTGVYRQTHTFDDKLYPLIVVEMTLKRRPIILIMTVIFPISVLSFLNVFVFLIPLESGERLSFSMSAFLSYAIFFDFILGSLPSSGDEVSLSLIIISAQLFLSSVYVLVGILTSALVHRDDATNPVPAITKTVVMWLEVLLCLKPTSRRFAVLGKRNVVGVSEISQVHGSKVAIDSIPRTVYGGQDNRVGEAPTVISQESMTWLRVCQAVDRLCFAFFFTGLCAMYTGFLFIMKVT